MSERYMNADRFVVIVLWVLALGLAKGTIVAAVFFGLSEEGMRVAIVALFPLTTLAAVMHIRLYAIRLASVIRAAAGIERNGDGLRSVR